MVSTKSNLSTAGMLLIMDLLLTYQWEIFITLEIISVLSLLIFGVVCYFFSNQKLSLLFLQL